MAQLVKNLPAVLETWVQFLGWEDPLEKAKATHAIILAWSPWAHKKLDKSRFSDKSLRFVLFPEEVFCLFPWFSLVGYMVMI